jgi:uncharacterized protein DUF11
LDPVFKPLQATIGKTRTGDTFTWQSFGVAPGKVGRVAILCRCEASASSACFYATVSDANGQQETDKACIPIYPAQSPGPMVPPTPDAPAGPGIDVKISKTHSPVNKGSTFSYHVFVENVGATEDSDVTLAIAFPPGLTPQIWGTRGHTRVRIRDNVARCDTIPILRTGTPIEYTIMVTADEVGQYTVWADVESVNLPEVVSASDTIDVKIP